MKKEIILRFLIFTIKKKKTFSRVLVPAKISDQNVRKYENMIKSGFSKFTKSSEQCKIPVDEIQIKPANRYQGNYIRFVLNLMSCNLKENQARFRMQQKNYGSDKLFSCNYLVPYEAFKSLYLLCDLKKDT